MKTKNLLWVMFILLGMSKSSAQQSNLQHSIFISIFELESIHYGVTNEYWLHGVGYQLHFNRKWSVFIQGHHKFGKYGNGTGESHRGGIREEWNAKIGMERKFRLSKRFNFLMQLALFKEHSKVENGLFTSYRRATIPWSQDLNWQGLELNLGFDFQITKHFSIFAVSGLEAGIGYYYDEIYTFPGDNNEMEFGAQLPLIDNAGIKYTF